MRLSIFGFGTRAEPPKVDADVVASLAAADEKLRQSLASNRDRRLIEAERHIKRGLHLLDPTHH